MNIDKAARYHRLKRRVAVGATVLMASMLAAAVATGASGIVRDLASAVAGESNVRASSPAVIGIYVLLLCAVWQVTVLPLAWYSGIVLEQRYGLSTESTGRWLRDYVKAGLLSTIVALAGVELVYFTIRQWPRGWWLAGALGCGAGILLLARAAPVVLLPLFYTFRPLDRPQLQTRLRELSDRAALPVLGVYEWSLGDRTRRANAALVGVGATRRILLSDTLLADYSDDEIEVILAHELAHHAHRDVITAVGVQTVLLLGGFGAAAWLLAGANTAAGIAGSGDVAGLPVLLLAVGGVFVAMTPLTNMLSRRQEHRADADALRQTERPAAFISAMRRLAAQNLAEPQPSRLVLWLFHSHPPIEERIERARHVETRREAEIDLNTVS